MQKCLQSPTTRFYPNVENMTLSCLNLIDKHLNKNLQVTPEEVAEEIKHNLNSKETTGYKYCNRRNS